jgi:RHS repeat-associated protein
MSRTAKTVAPVAAGLAAILSFVLIPARYSRADDVIPEYARGTPVPEAQFCPTSPDVRAIKDRTAVIGRYDYLPYGELTSYSTTEEYANDFLFGGKELESGLNAFWYDSGARYQTTHGIFTSQDPLAEQSYSISPYAYCNDNPVNMSDPYGLTSYNVNGIFEEIADGYYETLSVNRREFRALERDWNRGYGEAYDGRRQGLMDRYGYIDAGGSPVLAASVVSGSAAGYLSYVVSVAAVDLAAIEPSDALAPKWGVYVLGAATAFGADYYINKMNAEIARLDARPDGPSGVQYALRATVSKEYPNVRGGTTYLNAGDVWKYGETTQYPPEKRYGKTYLEEMNLTLCTEYRGTQKQIKIKEKRKSYSYFVKYGHLPPGNSIFR